MATFKAGQRVRINCPESNCHGKEATIVRVCPGPQMLGSAAGRRRKVGLHYDVCVDGVGTHSRTYGWQLAFEPHDLEPLTPPAEDAWAADAVRKVTKPQHVEPRIEITADRVTITRSHAHD
jgi:hypothetical protein